ncbi:hypothetical protein FJZ19_00615 [Candidatus Pacearchaeota archaeon]|nr:hypothetical protein [Candidatus Pacearchaeota archaeon]
MIILTERIEQLRQAGVREGSLYGCPQKLHAAKINVDEREYCEGHRIGVGGVGTSTCCLSCPHYISTGHEKPHLRG